MEKVRADVLLVERGLASSREKAQAQILAGLVFAGGAAVDRPGTKLTRDAAVEIRGEAVPYVSRGGLKLEKALDVFELPVAGRVAIDVGASTGGFTDLLLGRGAARVYAVDVGYGQLAWKLRQDPRVVVLERTNARYLTRESLAEAVASVLKGREFVLPDLATIDVSFISLDRILPAVTTLLRPPGDIVALVKPQFEAGRGQVGKHGVVRDPAIHEQVIRKVGAAASVLGLAARGLTCSPVTGPEGNVEFLLRLSPEAGGKASSPDAPSQVRSGAASAFDFDASISVALAEAQTLRLHA